MNKNRQRLRLSSPKTVGIRHPPPLRITPYAWRKLLFLRDLGPTEVGGFGISSRDDLLLVEDIALVRQLCSPVTVKSEDDAVADHFDRYVDRGYQIEQFGRIWVHTHPGDSASPSNTDEETLGRCFGGNPWAVMFILAKGGETYARLALNDGPGAELMLPVEIDLSQPFGASQETTWEQEYVESVCEERFLEPFPEQHRLRKVNGNSTDRDHLLDDVWLDDPFFYSDRWEVAGARF
jgi:hypothetical protein